MMFHGRNAAGLFAKSTGKVYVTLSVEKCGIKSRADAKNAALRVTKERGFPPWLPKMMKKPKESPGLCLVSGTVT